MKPGMLVQPRVSDSAGVQELFVFNTVQQQLDLEHTFLAPAWRLGASSGLGYRHGGLSGQVGMVASVVTSLCPLWG